MSQSGNHNLLSYDDDEETESEREESTPLDQDDKQAAITESGGAAYETNEDTTAELQQLENSSAGVVARNNNMPTRISIGDDDDNATMRSSTSAASGSMHHPRPTTFKGNNSSMFRAAVSSSSRSSTASSSGMHKSYVSVSTAATSKERQEDSIVSAFDDDDDDDELRIENLVAESVKESSKHFKTHQRRGTDEGIDSSTYSMIDEVEDDQNDGTINNRSNEEEKFEKNHENDKHDDTVVADDEHPWVSRRHEEEDDADFESKNDNAKGGEEEDVSDSFQDQKDNDDSSTKKPSTHDSRKPEDEILKDRPSADQLKKAHLTVGDCYDPKSEQAGDEDEGKNEDDSKNENDKKRKRCDTDNKQKKNHRSPRSNDTITQSNSEEEIIEEINTSNPKYHKKPPSSVSYVPTETSADDFRIPEQLASLKQQQQRPYFDANLQNATTTTTPFVNTQPTAAQPQSVVPFGQQQSMIVTQSNPAARHGGFVAPMTNASTPQHSGDVYYVTTSPAQNTVHATPVQMNGMNQVFSNAPTSEMGPYAMVQQKGETGPYAMVQQKSEQLEQQNPLVVETKIQRRPGELEKYRDYSKLPRTESDNLDDSPSQMNGKEPPFPVKLHRILSNEEYSDCIAWLPHGRSWRVLRPKAFEEKIIPNYFRHTKYASFMRQVNGWGFKRMTQGPDHNSYYHELFLRGLPHLCSKMRRPTRAKVLPNDPDTTPDFYQMSLTSPLPGDHDANDKKSKVASTSNNHQNNSNSPAINNNNTPPQVTPQAHNPQQTLSNRSIVQTTPVVGTVENFNMVPQQQTMQAMIQQNVGGYGQQVAVVNQPFPTPQAANATTIMTIPSNQSCEANQLDALKQRREELVRQLNGLKTQTATMQQIQSTEPTIMINQVNPMGTIQTIQTAQPATTQFAIPAGAQFQQMVTIENPAAQVGGIIQVPTYCGQQVNMTNIVGNPSPVNQQIIMQPAPAPMGGLIMNGNLIQQPVNAPVGTIMVQNHQVNPNQQFQIQGQPQFNQHQFNQPQFNQHQFSGHFNHGMSNGM